ncbi:hypothetical protein VIGAN_01191300 [Vigna angularis var. angularis]|uniref:Uncharacterized protein n=1 Tax=Vigna angularis var. angularis TaxID=157739 RepID=A0A0S3R166_PHAAN|nr:hypothetical protein VIGAN_01191300 [Vigna angularis var. angularis]
MDEEIVKQIRQRRIESFAELKKRYDKVRESIGNVIRYKLGKDVRGHDNEGCELGQTNVEMLKHKQMLELKEQRYHHSEVAVDQSKLKNSDIEFVVDHVGSMAIGKTNRENKK